MRPLARLLLLGGGRAAAAGLGALAAVVLARGLAPDRLGLWSLALAAQGYALHLGEFGLRSVATAEAARRRAPLRPLLARYLGLRLPLSLAVVAATAAGAALVAPGAWPVVALAAASILAAALQLDWLALADDRAGLAAALLLARPLAFLLLLLLLLACGGTFEPETVAALFLASWLAAAAASWLALRGTAPAVARGTDEPEPSPPPPGRRAMLRAGAPLCAVTVLNQAVLSGDLLLVGACLGTAAAGHYFVASQVAVAGLVVANAAGQAALARLARHTPASPAFAAALAAEAVPVIGCGLLGALALLSAGPWLLPALFGPDQAPAVPVLLALLPWYVLQHPTTLLQGALAAAGRGDRVLRGNLAMLLALAPALALAAATGDLVLFALARGVGEAARLAALLMALPPTVRAALLQKGRRHLKGPVLHVDDGRSNSYVDK